MPLPAVLMLVCSVIAPGTSLRVLRLAGIIRTNWVIRTNYVKGRFAGDGAAAPRTRRSGRTDGAAQTSTFRGITRTTFAEAVANISAVLLEMEGCAYSAIPVAPATWLANYRSTRTTPSMWTAGSSSPDRADESVKYDRTADAWRRRHPLRLGTCPMPRRPSEHNHTRTL